MTGVGFQFLPVAFGFRCFDPNVGIVRVIRNCEPVDAVVSSRFEDFGEKIHIDHTGCFLSYVKRMFHFGCPVFIEFTLKYLFAFGTEIPAGIIKYIGFIFREGRGGFRKRSFHGCIQIPGRSAMQPGRPESRFKWLTFTNGCFGKSQIDLQPVGLNGFNTDGLCKRGPAGFHFGDPTSGRRIGTGEGVEIVETIDLPVVHHPFVQLPLWSEQLKRNRMAQRKW